jgi:hypothetical protein
MTKTLMLATTIAGLTALAALPATDALAQTKAAVGGMVTLKLTDPAGGEPWRIQRRLLRTFSTTQTCETQKESFIGFHVSQVQKPRPDHRKWRTAGGRGRIDRVFHGPRRPLRTVGGAGSRGG